jgi:ribosomal protein S18 acetylase RimI-like enzyme
MIYTLRPVVQSDEPFLFTLYCSTRAEEVAAWGWDAHEQEVFLKLQFVAHRRYYQSLEGCVVSRIIMQNDEPIGWIATIDSKHAVYLADIALASSYRNVGIGTRILKEEIRAAEQAGKCVTLRVLKTNRAIRLYQRLGFVAVADDDVYIQMEKAATVAASM